jgi:hypothetical protein
MVQTPAEDVIVKLTMPRAIVQEAHKKDEGDHKKFFCFYRRHGMAPPLRII